MHLDKLFLRAAAIFCIASSFSFCCADEPREWTDSSGKFKVTATLESHDAKTATLRREDGKKIVLPLEKLSKADREYLETLEENPFETSVVEDDGDEASVASDKKRSTPQGKRGRFAINGAEHHFDECDLTVYVGSSSKDAGRRRVESNPLSNGGSVSLEKEWQVKPEIVEIDETAKLRTVPLADVRSRRNQFASGSGAIVPRNLNGSNKFFCVSRSYGVLDNQESFLEICDVEEGSSVVSKLTYQDSKLTDVSPDGKYALSIVGLKTEPGFGKKAFISITSLDEVGKSENLAPDAIFCPYFSEEDLLGLDRKREKVEEISAAFWIDDSHIFTASSRFDSVGTLWNLKGCVEERRLALERGAAIALSPDRKLLATATKTTARIYDASSLTSLGVLQYGAEAISPGEARCAFSPQGDKLAIFTGSSVAVFDLASGREETQFACNASLSGALTWASSTYVLVGDVGYDLGTGAPVCHYTGFNASFGSVSRFGRVWGITDGILVGAKLPGKKEESTLASLAQSDVFALRPGMALSIKTELNGLLDESEVAANLKKRLEEQGFKYDANAKTTLVATCRDTGETVEVTGAETEYRSLVPGLRAPRFIGSLGRGRVKAAATIDLKIFEEKISIVEGNTVLYDQIGSKTTGPDDLERDEKKTVEEQMRESNKPEGNTFKYCWIPQYVARGGKGDAATTATIGTDGDVR